MSKTRANIILEVCEWPVDVLWPIYAGVDAPDVGLPLSIIFFVICSGIVSGAPVLTSRLSFLQY